MSTIQKNNFFVLF